MQPNAHDVKTLIQTLHPDGGVIQVMKWAALSFGGHLHWEREELFPEHIQPWEMGPAVAEIYDYPDVKGNIGNLSPSQRASVERTLAIYGHLSGTALIELTHKQTQWIDARKGVTTVRSTKRIMPTAIAEYYDRTKELERDELREQMTQQITRIFADK